MLSLEKKEPFVDCVEEVKDGLVSLVDHALANACRADLSPIGPGDEPHDAGPMHSKE